MTTANSEVKKTLDALGERTGTHVVEQGTANSFWYRVWSDGFIEQGLIASASGDISSTTEDQTFTFPKPFSNAKYGVAGAGFVIAANGRQLAKREKTRIVFSSDGNVSATSGFIVFGY